VAGPDFYSVAPGCIQHDLPPGIPYSAEVVKPFEDCTGFFTFGPGREWAGATGYPVPEGGAVGQVLFGGSTGLYILTAIGFAVSILAFVAWVWFENLKLTDRAQKLRAAARPAESGPPPG
jgi:hypothetical protein